VRFQQLGVLGGRHAARRQAAHMASSSAITSNISTISCGDTVDTTAPRRGRICTSPADASWISASRIGVREAPNSLASSVSSRCCPGSNFPWQSFLDLFA
jgi:hypothetical protein